MNWYDKVFKNGLYDLFTFHLFTKARNREDAEFIARALMLKEGDHVLDTACGFGRHAALLAEENVQVTGVDNNARYINLAREHGAHADVSYLVQDLRKLEFVNQFDAAYNFFTSFGYYDEKTNLDILKRIAASLKIGGRFLLDLQNRELFSTGDPDYQEFTEFTFEKKKLVLLMTCHLDVESSRVDIVQRIYGLPEGPKEMKFDVRIYTMAELRWLFQQVGMEVIKTYGDTDSSEYSMTSQRCMVVGQKVE